MATLTSNPVALLVQWAGSTFTRFGTGADTGQLAGHLWKPGRDAEGRVNAVSWALVPSRRWITVADTRLDALEAVVKAALPGWADYGTTRWNGLARAWNGFGIDQTHSRVFLHGGGHSDSSNNGIYRFDMFRMMWSVEALPSDTTPWSETYKAKGRGGHFSECEESRAEFQARFAAGTLKPENDWYWDELFWDRKPGSRHTYSSLVYLPDRNELAFVCERLWRYSLTERRWTYKRLINDSARPYMDRENVVAIYDERAGEILASSAGSRGRRNAVGFALATQSWKPWSSPWNRFGAVADVRVGRKVVVMDPPWMGGNARDGTYWEYDLDRRAVIQSGTLRYGSGLSRESFTDKFYDGAALVHIPEDSLYWLLTEMRDGTRRFLPVDPSTSPWTLGAPMTFEGDTPDPGRTVERKLIYFPALRAILLADSATRNLSLFKVS